jgi:zinc protease
MAFRASLHRLVLLAILACAALAANAQTALPAGVTRGPSVEGITEYRLANGLTVLLFPDASKPTTTVNVTYKVGSRHENYGETGMAHLLEHLVFKGTPSIPSVFQELGRRGMQFNGTTSFDRTNYYETFTANDDNLDWALRMEAERMTQSKFAKADLDTEMTVVRNEFEMGENSPRRVLWKRLQSLAFDWHNYGNVTIGARSDVENVDIGRLRAFYETYYQPDNAVLIVAGKFDPEKTLGTIAKYFGAIPQPTRALPRLYTSEPVQDGERSTVVRRVGSQQLIGVLYRAMSGAHPDAVAMEALGEIMTVAPAGRLYKALVDTKKATGVDTWTFTLADPGAIIFWAQVALEDPVEPARDAMLGVLGNVAKQPITAEEVERVRAKALKSFDEVFNDPEQAGVSLSEAIATGDWRLFFLYRDYWRKLTPADVQRVATAWLKPANRTIGLFLPDANPDRAPEAATVDVAALVADYKGDAAAAAGETFDPTPANLDARTLRYTMANGMKVALLPKKTRGDVVRFAIRLHQGDEKSLAGTPPTGGLMGSMLARGTKSRDRQAFDDEIDKLRAKVALGGGSTSTSANGETVRANLGPTLKLAAEALRTPAFPAAEFDKLKRERVTALEASRTEPTAIAQRALGRHDNPYPKGDVRYSGTLDEDLAGIARVTLGDVAGFHGRFVGASHGEIALVGDFDPAEVRPLLEELFGGWKAVAPYARVPSPYRPTTAAALRFETPDKPNAIIIGSVNAQVRDLDPDYAALAVAERILGGGPEARIPARLREKEGLSYSAGSYLQPGQIDDLGSLGVYAIFPPQALAKVRTALDEELARALDAGFTADEVAAAKRALIEERRTNRAQDATLVAALASQAYLGRTFAESAKLDAAIEAVDPAAAIAALRKHLARDRIAWAFAGDFAKQ